MRSSGIQLPLSAFENCVVSKSRRARASLRLSCLAILLVVVMFLTIRKGSSVCKQLDLKSPVFTKSSQVLIREDEAIAIPVIGILVLNGDDLFLRLLRSIDCVVHTLVIFHNGDSAEDVNKRVRATIESVQLNTVELGHKNIINIISLYRTKNLGFSAGVNKIILATPSAPFWLITNNDVQFKPGMLQAVAHSMNDTNSQQHLSCIWALVGDPVSPYSSFILTRRAIDSVGFFDENFWPAYAEDCDYTARLTRSDCPIIFEKDTTRIAIHDASSTLRQSSAHSQYPKLVAQSGGAGFNNFDYIVSKWGVNVCNLRLSHYPFMSPGGFERPFNRSQEALSFWKVDMIRRTARGGPSECIMCHSMDAQVAEWKARAIVLK